MCLPDISSKLKHLNVDLQSNVINMNMFYDKILVNLSELKSFTYQAVGKSVNDLNELFRLSRQYERVKFICKGLHNLSNLNEFQSQNDLVTAIQQRSHQKIGQQSFVVHSAPYPDKTLSLPFSNWTRIPSTSENRKQISDTGSSTVVLSLSIMQKNGEMFMFPFRDLWSRRAYPA